MLTHERTIEEIMLSEEGRFLELYRGRPREKPEMSESHAEVLERLSYQLTL